LLAQAHSAREPLVRDSALHCLLGLTHDSAGLRWYDVTAHNTHAQNTHTRTPAHTHTHTHTYTAHAAHASLLDLLRAVLHGLTLRLCSFRLGAHNERMVEVLLMDYRSESHFVADSAVALLSALVNREGTYVAHGRRSSAHSHRARSMLASVQESTPSASPRRSTCPLFCPTFSRTRPRTRTSRSGRST
jgi:hypothetical protein